MSGEFDQLFACSWRGIEFPTTSVEVSFQHDHAEHKYYGVDGARVEATGRGPLNVTVTIPLVNGIVPGKNESWSVLYPTAFRELLTAVKDRRVGVFRHPELDQIECKVKSAEFRHSGEQRDGVTMTIHFVETLVDDLEVEFASPVTVAYLAALDLDASDADLRALVPTRPEMTLGIEDVLRSLSGAFDRVSVAANQSSNLLNRYAFHAERVRDSAVRARKAVLWPTIDAAHRVTSALQWLADHPPANRHVLVYEVKRDVTLPVLLIEMPRAKMSDVLHLNPRIMASPVVGQGTLVRYYDLR